MKTRLLRRRKSSKLLKQSPFLEAVILENDIGSTMLFLCLLYFCMTVHAFSQFQKLRSREAVNTKNLFLLSVMTACGLRLMCFAGFCLLDGSDVSISTQSVVSTELDLYARAVAILFDLPDFMLISTYVLLLLVWAECFLGSRRHWLSARKYMHDWHCAYLVFNVLLYGTQLCLYAAVFLDVDVVRMLYLIPACATFAVPIAHLLLYVSLSLTCAGFPMVSIAAAARLAHLTRVTSAWTVGRLLWATAVLTSIFKRTVSPYLKHDPSGVAIVALFFLSELCPFVLTLDSSLLQLLDQESHEAGRLHTHHQSHRPPGGWSLRAAQSGAVYGAAKATGLPH